MEVAPHAKLISIQGIHNCRNPHLAVDRLIAEVKVIGVTISSNALCLRLDSVPNPLELPVSCLVLQLSLHIVHLLIHKGGV